MRIAVAADHAGYPLVQMVLDEAKAAGHEAVYLGTHQPEQPADYPDITALACEQVMRGEAERAVVLCGSGVGASVTANKFPGVRAGLCHDHYSAHQGVEHDDVNVLCMGARIIGPETAREIVRAFLGARFSGVERHQRRLAKLKEIESRFQKA